jgi:hypothetical protein
MLTAKRAGPGVLALIALACGPTAPETSRMDASRLEAKSGEFAEKVTGGGQFVHPTFGTVSFSFVARRHADGRVTGRFMQDQHDLGLVYKGVVTCFAVDPVNHRAWIGGVLTESNDTDPENPFARVDDDAWFRVLDLGKGKVEPDRSTFLGFNQVGAVPPFDTSENYCAGRPWPEGNARTWPVVRGDIKIR